MLLQLCAEPLALASFHSSFAQSAMCQADEPRETVTDIHQCTERCSECNAMTIVILTRNGKWNEFEVKCFMVKCNDLKFKYTSWQDEEKDEEKLMVVARREPTARFGIPRSKRNVSPDGVERLTSSRNNNLTSRVSTEWLEYLCCKFLSVRLHFRNWYHYSGLFFHFMLARSTLNALLNCFSIFLSIFRFHREREDEACVPGWVEGNPKHI